MTNPNGIQPRSFTTWNRYYIPATDTNAYRVGDVVKSAGGADAAGVPAVTLHPGTATPVRGVILSIDPGLPSTGGFTNGTKLFIPAAKAQGYYVWVDDDPSKTFVGVDDGATPANLVAASIGTFANFTPSTGPSADGANSSTLALQSSTFGSTSGCLKLIGLAPGSGFGAGAQWLFKFAQHELAQGGTSTSTASASASSALQPFFESLGSRNFSPVDILASDDSVGEGRTVTAFGRQYLHRLRDAMRAKFQTTGIGAGGGVGYIPLQNTSVVAPYANPFVISGTPQNNFTNGGLGFHYTVLQAAGDKAVATLTGTSFTIHFLTGTSSRIFYYKINGGAAVTKETNTGVISDTGTLTVSSGMAAGQTYTLEIGYSSGGSVYVGGVFTMDGDEAKGIRMYEDAHTGYRAVDYASLAQGGGFANHIQRCASVAPKLWIIGFGLNEYGEPGLQRTSAQYLADTQAYIALGRAAGITCPILLLTKYDITGGNTAGGSQPSANAEPWANYVAAAASIAASDTGGVNGGSGVAAFAMSAPGHIPALHTAPAGLFVDGFHGADAIHGQMGDLVAAALSPF